MSAPATHYCLKCKKYQGFSGATLTSSHHTTKNGKPMTRAAWVGSCAQCSCKMRRFASSKGSGTSQSQTQ